MRGASTSFLKAVRGSHQVAVRARIVPPGQTGTQPNGLFLPTDKSSDPPSTWGALLPESGDVTTDMTADVQSTLAMIAKYSWPIKTTDPGTPYGQEIYVERGLVYGNGTRELVGLGYFRIDKISQGIVPDGPISIAGSDRMARVKDGRNIIPVQYPGSAFVGDVLDAVIGAVVPGFISVYETSFYNGLTAYQTPLVSEHVLDRDRLAFVQDILQSYGKYGYFGYDGKFYVKSIPDTTKAKAVFTLNHGKNGVLATMNRELSREGVSNVFVAQGQPIGESAPVQAIVSDNTPTSPTYTATFGFVPTFYESAFLTTSDQCAVAAAGMFLKQRGLPYSVGLGTVPNPALEGYDVVNVTYADTANTETHVIDRISYPLDVETPMAIDTRKQFL